MSVIGLEAFGHSHRAAWGELAVTRQGSVTIFTRKIYDSDLQGASAVAGRVLARWDDDSNLLSLFPHQTVYKGDGRAYSKISEIQLDTSILPDSSPEDLVSTTSMSGTPFLEGLPKGLGNNFEFGLSLPRPYGRLIREIEEDTECSVLHLHDVGAPKAHGNVFHLGLERFTQFVIAADRHLSRSSVVATRLNDAEAKNLVLEALGHHTQDPSLVVSRSSKP